MHSEQLSNLHIGWVVGGWFIAASITAAIYMAGIGLGMVGPVEGAASWIVLALGAGFFVGGVVVGMRWNDAPVLHGAAITLVSVVVWFVVSVFGEGGPLDSVQLVLGLLLVQLLASSAGGWMGRKWSLGGANGDSIA